MSGGCSRSQLLKLSSSIREGRFRKWWRVDTGGSGSQRCFSSKKLKITQWQDERKAREKKQYLTHWTFLRINLPRVLRAILDCFKHVTLRHQWRYLRLKGRVDGNQECERMYVFRMRERPGEMSMEVCEGPFPFGWWLCRSQWSTLGVGVAVHERFLRER